MGSIVIVGASGDIGSTLAQSLLPDYDLALLSRSDPSTKWSGAERRVTTHKCNVADPSSVNVALDEVRNSHPSIDGLVYAAGHNHGSPLAMTTTDSWREHIDANLTGAFYVVRAAARTMMVQGHGSIVLIGSIIGHVGNEGQAAYAASKAGLVGLMKVASLEFARYNVRINLLAVGPVVSRMTADIPKVQRDRLMMQMPQRKIGDPGDIVGTVRFLVGHESTFMTGSVLTLDGGYTAR
ncbi:MAG: hypothetical protein OMOMHJEC_03289 [Xanthomonadales bacterium]|nr:hypothetical protein [Xanthomonadales bacterium]